MVPSALSPQPGVDRDRAGAPTAAVPVLALVALLTLLGLLTATGRPAAAQPGGTAPPATGAPGTTPARPAPTGTAPTTTAAAGPSASPGAGGGDDALAALAAQAGGVARLVDVHQAGTGVVLVVRNDGTRPCQVFKGATATVSLASVQVAGRPVTPALSFVLPEEPLEQSLLRQLVRLDPGATVEVPLRFTSAADGGTLLHTVSLGRDSVNPARAWALHPGDRADVAVLYGLPTFAGAPDDLCLAADDAETATFTVPTVATTRVAVTTTPDRSWTTWAIVGLGVLFVLVFLVLLLVLRRQRSVPTAVLVLLVVAAALALAGSPTVPAAAQDGGGGVSFEGFDGHPEALAGYQGDFNQCMQEFRGNDPAGVLQGLDFSKVRLGPSSSGDENYEQNDSNGRELVYWNTSLTDTKYGDGTVRDLCSPLYHELYHAMQDQQGKLVNTFCYVAGKNTGIATSEVMATRAQNAFRRNAGLAPRTEYSYPQYSYVLPADDATCDPPPKDKPQAPTQQGSSGDPDLDDANRVPPGGGKGGNRNNPGGGQGGGSGQGGSGSGGGSGTGGSGSGGGGSGGGGTGSGGGSGSGGSSGGGIGDWLRKAWGWLNGDPHLNTFDGRLYDFQAVGEFVVTRATDGDGFAIHARYAPVPGSRTASVANQIGLDVAGDRLTVEMAAGRLVLGRDGRLEPFTGATVELPHGGRVLASDITPNVGSKGGGIEVVWPDGSRAYIAPIGRWGLVVSVGVADARRGHVEGLLGNADGDPANDLVADGPVADGGDGKPEPRDLYGRFADHWRVGRESLLRYRAGETTDTFTDRAFPDSPPPSPSPEARAVAADTCRAANVPDGAALDSCIIDVVLTGEASYSGSAHAITVLSGAVAGTDGGAGGTPTEGGTTTTLPRETELRDTGSARIRPGDRLRLEGEVSAGSDAVFTVSHDPGQIIFVTVDKARCEGTDGFVDVKQGDGGTVGTSAVCAEMGRVVLTDAADHTIRISTPSKARYAVLVSGVPPDVVEPLRLDTELDGSISAAGARTVYELDAQPGRALWLRAPACGSGDGLAVDVKNAGGLTVGTSTLCGIIGRVDLRDPGRYTVVVYGSGDAHGPFRLTVRDVPPDLSVTVADGDTIRRDQPVPGAGRVEVPGAADRYLVDLRAGETLELDPVDGCAASRDLDAEVVSPGGVTVTYDDVCRQQRVEIKESGLYTVRVAGSYGTDATGEYGFTVRVR